MPPGQAQDTFCRSVSSVTGVWYALNRSDAVASAEAMKRSASSGEGRVRRTPCNDSDRAFGGARQAFGCFFAVSVMMGPHCAPVNYGARSCDARRLLGIHRTSDERCPDSASRRRCVTSQDRGATTRIPTTAIVKIVGLMVTHYGSTGRAFGVAGASATSPARL